MHQEDFGSILAAARKQSGYTVEDVADRLRVRPDIVYAIEHSDLHSLPPRANTRGMIARYARLVHLDSDSIVKLYEETSYTLDISETRQIGYSTQKRGSKGTVSLRPSHNQSNSQYGSVGPVFDSSQSSERRTNANDIEPLRMPTSRMSSAYSLSHDDWNSPDQGRYRNSVSGRISLNMNDEETDDLTNGAAERRRGSRNYSASASSYSHNPKSSRTHASATTNGYAYTAQKSRSRSSRGNTVSGYGVSTMYAPNAIQNARGAAASKKPLIIIIVAVLIIVLAAVIFAVVSNGKAKSNQVSTKAPITGLTDTTASDESTTSIVAPVAPTSAEFAYSVNSGIETYIEIYIDDSETASFAQVVSGPSKNSYTVTGKLKFVCTQPDGVKLTVDGESVSMTPSEETSWLYEYELDFSEYLANWQKEHAEEIAAAEKAKAELLASQQAASASPSASTGSTSSSSSSGKTTTSQ